jgi:hypothetical protein
MRWRFVSKGSRSSKIKSAGGIGGSHCSATAVSGLVSTVSSTDIFSAPYFGKFSINYDSNLRAGRCAGNLLAARKNHTYSGFHLSEILRNPVSLRNRVSGMYFIQLKTAINSQNLKPPALLIPA